MKNQSFLWWKICLKNYLQIGAIRQKMSKTKSVVDDLKKSSYNNFASKTQVGASKSAKRLG